MVRFGQDLSKEELIKRINNLKQTQIGEELYLLRNELCFRTTGKESDKEKDFIESKKTDVSYEFYSVVIKKKSDWDLSAKRIKEKIQEINKDFTISVKFYNKVDLDDMFI